MRILAIADIEEPVLYEETKREKIGPIDLIISCGDLSSEYLSYISTMYQAPLFFVRGNHDTELLFEGPVGENLHNKLIKYRNIKMLGFEGAPNYTENAIQYSESKMNLWFIKSYFKTLVFGRPDIIVTHVPPKGIHDGKDFAHRGFPAFNKMITHFKPQYFLHGHNQSNYYLNYDRKYSRVFDHNNPDDYNVPWITKIESTTVMMIFGYCILNY
jgi:uncharacterized protein